MRVEIIEKKNTGEANNVVVVSGQWNTRGNPIFDTSWSQNGKIPKALKSHLKAGPGEEQRDRLIIQGFCNISGCEIKTSVSLKYDMSYDSTTNYADKCRNICYREYAK